MMNKTILQGRLTRDPEMRYTQGGIAVASFTLAVNRRYTKQGEERQADFFNITTWNKTAEFATNYLKKGQQVSIIGRLQNRSWEDNQGQKKYATDIIAEEVYPIWNKTNENEKLDDFNTQTTSYIPEDNFLKNDDLPF